MSILWTLGGIMVCAALVAIWTLAGRGRGVDAAPDLPDVRYPEQLRRELWPDSPAPVSPGVSNDPVKNHGRMSRRDIPSGG